MSSQIVPKMTVKKALIILAQFKMVKFKCITPPRFEEAMDKLDRENRCMNCGKKMYNVKDKRTGKIDKYQWKCSCFPKEIVLSKG